MWPHLGGEARARGSEKTVVPEFFRAGITLGEELELMSACKAPGEPDGRQLEPDRGGLERLRAAA